MLKIKFPSVQAMNKLKLSFFLTAIGLLLCSFVFSQGTIRGKITDENGETLIGVAIVLNANRSVGTVTDFDGNYSLKVSDSTAQTILITYVGYQVIEESVHPGKGEVIVKNFVLKSSAQAIKEVEIAAKAVKSKEYFIENVKKKSATTFDYISSETIRKTGDANVTAAVTRVTGVSTNGSFITVRGIGDRYVKTSINGSRIPTLDPFTNNIKLDLFPASLVDNVIITKTASPDLPGDFAGAYISVETKDYPEQLSVNVETSLGYNNQSTFKDVITSQRSSTDWLGYDNNLRDRTHTDFAKNFPTPTQYQEFVALGLGPYFNSLGVTQENWSQDNNNGDTYFRLGLVQLGLLPPALINDNTAYQNAVALYLGGTYKSQAFNTINAEVPQTGKSFPDNWNTQSRKAPLNFSQSFSIGNQTTLLGKPLGFLFGYRYGSSITYDPDSRVNRLRADGSLSSTAHQEAGKETNGWSALVNLAYKLNPNNSVSLLFMPNFTGINSALGSLDTTDVSSNSYVLTKSQFYEQRRQLVYQFKAENYLPGTKIKIETDASYTNGKSSAPDFKNIQYWYLINSHTYEVDPAIRDGVHRYYRYLSDNLFDSRMSIEFPLDKKPGVARKIKFGGAYQKNDKVSDQYDYRLAFKGNSVLTNNDLDAFFDLSKFEIRNYTDVNGYLRSTIDDYYELNDNPAYHTFGKSEIGAGFALVDYAIIPRLRFLGGLRVEAADLFTDVYKFDSLGYAANDPRRDYSSSYPLINPGTLNETSYLPSANVIYKLKDSDTTQINLRLNYSETVARPGLRELSDVALLDYEFREFVFGNSELKSVRIKNYDMRVESYFKSGDNISMSLFYKDFKNHIELVKSVGLTWQNVDKSHVMGIELEGRKTLPAHLELRANVALIRSETKFVRSRIDFPGGIRQYIPIDTLTRTMYGQAPYVINGILAYNSDSLGLSVAVSYNVQGERLVITSDNPNIPDVYEQPRHLLDVKVTKKLGKHFGTSLTVRDVFNSSVIRSYKGSDVVFDKYTYGTNYILSFSYKL